MLPLVSGLGFAATAGQRAVVRLRAELPDDLHRRGLDLDAGDAGLAASIRGQDSAVRIRARDHFVSPVGNAVGYVDVLLRQVPRVDVAPAGRNAHVLRRARGAV